MKDYEELKFQDDFMFCKILQENEDLCKELTELVIGRKIGSIVKTEKQKAIKVSEDGHGVRFDVYFEDDEKTVYDIEMQRSDTLELPLRSRYYQGMIDVDYLEKGKEYKELPDSYIIFLCTFDLFKMGYHKYSFEPMCREVENLLLDDGTNRTFICAGGDKDDVSEDMKSLIDYLAGKDADSNLTSRIDAKVKEAIEKSLWRKEYMTYKEQLDQEFNRGWEAGNEHGIEQGKEQGIETGRVIARFEDGMPIEEIAKKCGITVEAVKKILEEYKMI
ncbi:conserved hypothetical protein (putative transposase or invertase) [Butyrivibrio fibrisolvens DSM 3071]|uniref:PD-(D/E)XK nuclease family transposase n=1 Tax=Butyrivibrio fibrisolvens DSM 3071 TaxID=1121131 RepID=A0A1M5X296_BUTFI|nr:Rpn family recombination-promoting nuclease/putative transposase [Butyrivibrio fibrisolvens]SHH93668.1 conserved hypothetical protein (putative transposase or invertase) [Butyrivibrio fibrisolvens DSM 3071]